MKKIWIMLIFTILWTAAAHAETRYVTDRFEVTLRTGPGNDYRIVRMMTSGQRVELLETANDWSRIQMPGGPEGWILSRFLQPDPAARQRLQALNNRLETLQSEHELLLAENERLENKNLELSEQLDDVTHKLEETTRAYEQLEEDSAEFLRIKKEFEELAPRLEEKQTRIEELEGLLTEEFLSSALKWFLAGAGVLLLGMLLGSRLGKKRTGLR